MKIRMSRLRFDDRLSLPVGALPTGISSPLPPGQGTGDLASATLQGGSHRSPASSPGASGLSREGGLGWALLVVLLCFAALVARLVYLQVVQGEAYYQRSTSNFIKERDWPAVRGQLRDRKGRILVENNPAYSVYVTPQFATSDSLARLRRHLDLSEEQYSALLDRVAARRHGKERSQMFLAMEHLTRDQMALLETDKPELHGIDLVSRSHRSYPHGALGAHLLGYLNQVGPSELGPDPAHSPGGRATPAYRPGDSIGRSGIERLMESTLRGIPGYEKIVVDAYGRKKTDRELGELAQLLPPDLRREPVPGHHVVLSLDADLQRIVERALSRHHSAAAAVVETDTGKVLALASHPSPDPNQLSGRLSHAEAQRLQSDPFRPLLDKALRESYYPGSTFKIVPALSALEERLIDPNTRIPCHGRYELGRHVFRCMKSHGPVNLHEAIAQSCNVYFYHLAEKVGLERMAQMASAFGFGQGLDLGMGEASGFMPTLEYYKKNGGFRGGYALNTALGQGAVRASVLQLALAYAALGNGGKLYQPLLVERIEKPSGEIVEQSQPRLRGVLPVSSDSLERMRRALVDVLADSKGTAASAYSPSLAVYDIAGKSGTAQVRKNRRGSAPGWDTGNDHAWFVGYAPSHKSRIAVAVLIEHGGLGGHVAAPTAIDIIRGYFDEVSPEDRPKPFIATSPTPQPPSAKSAPVPVSANPQ